MSMAVAHQKNRQLGIWDRAVRGREKRFSSINNGPVPRMPERLQSAPGVWCTRIDMAGPTEDSCDWAHAAHGMGSRKQWCPRKMRRLGNSWTEGALNLNPALRGLIQLSRAAAPLHGRHLLRLVLRLSRPPRFVVIVISKNLHVHVIS